MIHSNQKSIREKTDFYRSLISPHGTISIIPWALSGIRFPNLFSCEEESPLKWNCSALLAGEESALRSHSMGIWVDMFGCLTHRDRAIHSNFILARTIERGVRKWSATESKSPLLVWQQLQTCRCTLNSIEIKLTTYFADWTPSICDSNVRLVWPLVGLWYHTHTHKHNWFHCAMESCITLEIQSAIRYAVCGMRA